MKFLCDVHISIKIAKSIEDFGYECEHVNRILNKWNTSDLEIIGFADDNDFILITKDQDFRDSFLLNAKPNKLIKINLGNISNEILLNRIGEILPIVERINGKNKNFMIEVSKSTSSIIIKE